MIIAYHINVLPSHFLDKEKFMQLIIIKWQRWQAQNINFTLKKTYNYIFCKADRQTLVNGKLGLGVSRVKTQDIREEGCPFNRWGKPQEDKIQ